MIKKLLPMLALLVAAPMFPYSIQRIFLHTPIEAAMGTVQKIFYFHVANAWLCFLFAVVSGIAAGIQLKRDSARADAVAIAGGELAVICGAAVLISGPLWGARTWGTPWTGDARLVSTALLWLIFVSYLLVRRYGPSNTNRLAAGLAVFGAVNVPIIYYAVKLWKTTHPDTTVVGSLPAVMWAAFWPGLIALILVSLGVFFIRVNQERVSQALDDAWIALDQKRASTRSAT